MCGIFGVIKPSGVPPEWIEQLGQLNTVRGNIAFGGLIWSHHKQQLFRFNHPFDAGKIDVDQATVVLGHIRAPTGGQSAEIREVHPFEAPDLLLAHNGILLNHASFPQWRLMPDVNVDSQVIAGGIQHGINSDQPLVQAITGAVTQLDGQQGCWLWHKPASTLYLWRVMSSLYYCHTPGCFVFSSVKCELADQLLPEGTVYLVDKNAADMSVAGTFDFYTPYKIIENEH